MPTGSEFDNVQLGGDNSFKSSSKMSGDPKELLAGSTDCIFDHADMNQQFGLNQPVAGLGTHPWLRDSLATSGDEEPGNAVPAPGQRMPGKET